MEQENLNLNPSWREQKEEEVKKRIEEAKRLKQQKQELEDFTKDQQDKGITPEQGAVRRMKEKKSFKGFFKGENREINKRIKKLESLENENSQIADRAKTYESMEETRARLEAMSYEELTALKKVGKTVPTMSKESKEIKKLIGELIEQKKPEEQESPEKLQSNEAKLLEFFEIISKKRAEAGEIGGLDMETVISQARWLDAEDQKEFKDLLGKFRLDKSRDDFTTVEKLSAAKLSYLHRYHIYKKEMSAAKRIGQGLKDALWSEVKLPDHLKQAKDAMDAAQKAHIAKLYELDMQEIERHFLDPKVPEQAAALKQRKEDVLRKIFEKEVVGHAQEMQRLEAEAASMREKSRLEQLGAWYAKRPAWQRVAISATIGTTIFGAVSLAGAATLGAGAVATAGYAGTRLARGAAAEVFRRGLNYTTDKIVDTEKIKQKNTEEIANVLKAQAEGEKEASEMIQGLEQALEDYKKTIKTQLSTERKKRRLKTAIAITVGGLVVAESAGVFDDAEPRLGSQVQDASEDFTRKTGSLNQQTAPADSLQQNPAVADSLDQGSVNESVAEDPQAETEQGATSAEETAGAAVETNENIPNEAYIQKGDGYTHAYLRQLEANTNGIAEKLGFDSDASLAEKKVFVAKLAEKLGQLESVDVDGDGSISANEQWNAGKGLKYNPDKGLQIAVVLDVDANGNPVVQKFFEGKLVASKGIPGYEMSYGPAAGSGAAETTVDTDSRVLSKEELEQTAPQQAETQPTSGRVLSADELRQSVENQFKAPTGEYGDNTNTGRVLTREELLGTQKAETIGSRPGVQTIEGLGQYVTNSPYFKDFAFEFVRENGQIVSFNEFKGEFFADKYTLPGLREDWQSILESNSKFPVSKAEEYINNIKQAKALQELYQPGTPEYVFLQDKIIIKGETTLKDFGLFEEPAITTPEAPVETTRNITGAAANDFLVENNIHTNWRNQAGMLDAVTRAQVSGKLDEMAVYTQDLQGLEPGSPEYIETQSKIDAIETKLRETYGDSLFTDMRETAKAIDPKDYFTYNEEGEIKYARTPDVTGMATDLKLEELGIRTDWQDTPGLDKRSVVSRLQRTLDEYVAWNNAHEQFKNDLGVDSQEYGYAEAEMRKIEAKLREDYPTVFAGKDLDLTISGDKTFEQLLEEQGLEEKDIVSRGESAMKDELQRFLGDKDMNYKQGVWREMRNLSAKEVIDDGTGKYEKFDFKNIGALEKPEDRLTAYTSYLRNQLHLEPVGGEKLDDYLERARIELEKQKFISNNQ